MDYQADRKTALEDVKPSDGFAFLAGQTQGVMHNHPCLYACAGNDGDNELVVRSRFGEKRFPIRKGEEETCLVEAMQHYTAILLKCRYINTLPELWITSGKLKL